MRDLSCSTILEDRGRGHKPMNADIPGNWKKWIDSPQSLRRNAACPHLDLHAGRLLTHKTVRPVVWSSVTAVIGTNTPQECGHGQGCGSQDTVNEGPKGGRGRAQPGPRKPGESLVTEEGREGREREGEGHHRESAF